MKSYGNKMTNVKLQGGTNMKKITSILVSMLFVITAMFTGCGKEQAANSTNEAKGKTLVYGAEM